MSLRSEGSSILEEFLKALSREIRLPDGRDFVRVYFGEGRLEFPDGSFEDDIVSEGEDMFVFRKEVFLRILDFFRDEGLLREVMHRRGRNLFRAKPDGFFGKELKKVVEKEMEALGKTVLFWKNTTWSSLYSRDMIVEGLMKDLGIGKGVWEDYVRLKRVIFEVYLEKFKRSLGYVERFLAFSSGRFLRFFEEFLGTFGKFVGELRISAEGNFLLVPRERLEKEEDYGKFDAVFYAGLTVNKVEDARRFLDSLRRELEVAKGRLKEELENRGEKFRELYARVYLLYAFDELFGEVVVESLDVDDGGLYFVVLSGSEKLEGKLDYDPVRQRYRLDMDFVEPPNFRREFPAESFFGDSIEI